MTRMMESDLIGSWVLKATFILYAANEVGNMDERRNSIKRLKGSKFQGTMIVSVVPKFSQRQPLALFVRILACDTPQVTL